MAFLFPFRAIMTSSAMRFHVSLFDLSPDLYLFIIIIALISNCIHLLREVEISNPTCCCLGKLEAPREHVGLTDGALSQRLTEARGVGCTRGCAGRVSAFPL